MLKNLVCDSCDKYLSVKPVKMYPDRTIKCGRCSKDGDEGVVSLFGKIADQGLFKCINRYDGCSVLLTYLQVPDHEKECKSTTYLCPVCLESNDIPIYLLMKHFEKKHKANVLSRPCFNIRSYGTSEENHIFLYEQEDTLFFIKYKLELDGFLLLSASQVGRNNTMNKYKFFLHWEEGNTETETKTCSNFDSGESEGFLLEISRIIRFMNVEFQLVVDDSTEMKLSILPKVAKIVSCIPPNSDPPAADKATNEKQIYDMPKNLTSKTRQPRKIHLNKKNLQYHFENSDVSVCSNGTALKIGEIVMFLYCFKCHEICGSPEDYHKGFYYGHKRKYNFICYHCSQVYRNTNVDYVTICSNFLLEYSLFRVVQYFCTWSCGETFDNYEIDDHEIHCVNQTNLICPFINCNERKENLTDVSTHFKTKHNTMYNTKLVWTKNWTNLTEYDPLSRSYKPTPYYQADNYVNQRPTGGMRQILLKPHFNLTKRFTEWENYVWVSNIFLKMKITWLQMTEIIVEISTCGWEGSTDGLPAKALIFNGRAYTIVGEGTKCKIDLPSRDISLVLVKCYLEH
ncbi:hypothetical protein JTB14_001809 [Gonioctena quinquepunctata]|nr:hypothetical protein JTB14_001809 [Gonioctena quinquepunctata]